MDKSAMDGPRLVLGIDTCGPAGSVALSRLHTDGVEALGERTLEGRTYSATLVAAIGDLLTTYGADLRDVGCVVVTSGPGSFTGVRVGLSAAKGLAEGAGLHLVAVSRLAVLAQKAGQANAALDAHRHEVFLRVQDLELLAGGEELQAIHALPEHVGICDDGAAALLGSIWPGIGLVRVAAPTALDAIAFAVPRILTGDFEDPMLLDGNYLRRSDAEIFGDKSAAASHPQP